MKNKIFFKKSKKIIRHSNCGQGYRRQATILGIHNAPNKHILGSSQGL